MTCSKKHEDRHTADDGGETFKRGDERRERGRGELQCLGGQMDLKAPRQCRTDLIISRSKGAS